MREAGAVSGLHGRTRLSSVGSVGEWPACQSIPRDIRLRAVQPVAVAAPACAG